MRKVLTCAKEIESSIFADDIGKLIPVFAKDRDARFVGMIVEEKGKWITRVGGGYGSTGWYDTMKECIIAGEGVGYTYYIE